MAAQYRPYRDQDSVDGFETTSWTDNEPGTLQIYEKTTEELPLYSAHKRAFWIQIALLSISGFLGFMLGYFGPFHQSDLLKGREENSRLQWEHSDSHEDPTIKSKLMAQIDSNNILFLLKKYENTNRMPGTNSDHEFAQYIHDLFHEYGFDPISVINNTFETMLPKQASVVRLLDKDNNSIYSNLEAENYIHEDMRPFLPLSQASEQIITTNQILYLNRGTKDDYLKLTSLGLRANETEGKVLIIRQPYYQAHEVVISAQEYGAKAVLLFPDPELFGNQSPFPKSIQLPEDSAKAHPLAWSNYGDLAALNLSSLNGMDISKLGLDKDSKVQIPVVLISFKTAEKLLRGLSGVAAPSEWNCFDYTLYLGPGYKEGNEDRRDKIRVEFYNQAAQVATSIVTGVISGAVEPDRYIIIGGRRDSLNRGLLDSVSGTATMLEIARVYGNLLKQGWRPRRSIIFSSFGAESLNLIGSSSWLEAHQRLLHSRAVAYINCDSVVIGNQSLTIAASPMLYQVIYNATKQVLDPSFTDGHPHSRTVYDVWLENHFLNHSDRTYLNSKDPELNSIFEKFNEIMHNDSKAITDTENNEMEEPLGNYGKFFHVYLKSAMVKSRPKIKRLDLQSIYSPFFLYAGIPVADVKYTGFQHSAKQTGPHADIIEDTLPILRSKHDNFAAIQNIDPNLKYHVTVAQVLSEILRDLSDSVFLPFNLLDYAMTLRHNYGHLMDNHGKTLIEANLDMGILRDVIDQFVITAALFHERQDSVDLRDSLKVRRFNDQMMLLERAFIDPIGPPTLGERKHTILAPHDGQDHKEGFPVLVDLITMMDGESLDAADYSLFVEILKVHYNTVVHTISNAVRVIDEVHKI